MVIAAATRQVSTPVSEVARPTSNPAADPLPAPSGRRQCPRCDKRMTMGYDEPQCLNCGYADYTYTRMTPRNGNNLFSTATRYVLRYTGDFPTLSERLAHVKLIRVRNRVLYAVECPFCDKAMDQSSLSGKRPEVREQRYKCMDGHRVSLVPGKNGMMGWR